MITDWDIWFLKQAKNWSEKSKDPSTKIGAIIADPFKRLVSASYNGFARQVRDLDERLEDRETKYQMTIHGELNAILFANRDLHGCTIYTYPFQPCSPCAACIIQVGITRVVSLPASMEVLERWGDSFELANRQFGEAEVVMEYVKESEIEEADPR